MLLYIPNCNRGLITDFASGKIICAFDCLERWNHGVAYHELRSDATEEEKKEVGIFIQQYEAAHQNEKKFKVQKGLLDSVLKEEHKKL